MDTVQKKIAVITSVRINSGSGFRMQGIAKYLARRGHAVTLSGIGRPDVPVPGVRYYGLPDAGFLPLTAAVAFLLNMLLLLQARPEIVFVSKPLPPSFVPAWLFALMIKCRLLLDVDDVEHDYWREQPLYRRILLATERFAVKRAELVTTHSEDLKRYLRDERGVAARTIIDVPQGIDMEQFSAQQPDAGLLQSLGLKGKKVIVYAAHFNVAVKDFDVILQMAARLARERQDFALLVIGDGPALETYRRRAAELGIARVVCFAGYVPHAAVGQYLSLGHVAVNYLESTPANICRASIKLREYLACGLWVVANTVSDDTRQFGSALLTFSTGDLDGFCAQVRAALERSAEGRNREGAALVADQFLWPRAIDRFASELEVRGKMKLCGSKENV